MYTLFVFLLIVVGVSGKFAERFEEHWANFKVKFHRNYATTEEHDRRRELFRQAMIRVDQKNAINVAANGEEVFGITKFSDWTSEEFSVLLGRKGSLAENANENVLAPISFKTSMRGAGAGALPTYVNWGEQGKVTPVKNQGQCGTCWAFSAAETVESQWAMNGNPIWEFSVQQIASCTSNCYGCGGGLTENAYDYIKGQIGLGSAAWGPYVQSMTESCLGPRCTESCDKFNMTVLATSAFYTGPYASVTSYVYTNPPCKIGSCSSQNTTQLAAAVATNGPASVCVNAANWVDYAGGVMSQAACGGYSASSIDHCVQLTGYNAGATNPYWLVRNSWATNWGEKGYILLQYPLNTCGLANGATQVVLGNSQANFTSSI